MIFGVHMDPKSQKPSERQILDAEGGKPDHSNSGSAYNKADPEPFVAELRPYRSLGPQGFFILMSLIIGFSFVAGIAFTLVGAWPVFGFFGLDVALIYFAFRMNYRSGRMFERVVLDREALTVTRVDPQGREKSWSFNPYWVRFQFHNRDRDEPELKLSTHGQELIFGRFLNEDEKSEFGMALAGAIATNRR